MSDTPTPPSAGGQRFIDTRGGSYFEGNIAAGGDFVAGDKIIQQAAPVGAAALRQLPAPPADFTGRQAELAELRAAIQGGKATILGLRGQGGVGKSTLATLLAQELAPAYPDAQLFLELHGAADQSPVAPTDALAHFIHAFEPTAQLPQGLAERQAIYRSLLAGKRALVVLDNARDRAQAEPLLPPPGCLVLLTSRQRFSLPGLAPHNLGPLQRTDSVALLLKIAARIGDNGEAEAEALADLCGDLPLALRLAGSALADSEDLAVDDYLARMTDERRRLAEFGEVAQALAASYGLLSESLQAAWPPLAVFAGSFDRPAAAAVLGLDEEAAGTTLSGLLRYSLLDYDNTTKRYRLHDLARLEAGQRLSPEVRAAAEPRHAEYYRAVLAMADERYREGGAGVLDGLALFDQERANIEAGQAWAAARCAAEADETAARLCSDYPAAGAYVLDLRQHPRQQIAWLEAALAAAQRLQDREMQAAHLGNLGNAYADLAETRRAIELYEQYLAITREIGDRRGEGGALGNLGTAYRQLGEVHRAIEFQEQSLAIDRELGDQQGESISLANLGGAYFSLGETERAIEFYEQHLAMARELGDRRGEGTGLGNLGLAHAQLGETQRAIELYEQALAIDREVGDRSSESSALGNLGMAYADLGETQRATELYEQALAIDRDLGDRHGEAQALANLANAYADLGETSRAIELYELRLGVAREIGDRPEESATLLNLGVAYSVRGESRRAVEVTEQALAILRELGDRPGQATALLNLGSAYADLGETQRAIELYEQHLAMARELGDRRGEGAALSNLAAAYADRGESSRAKELYEQALVIDREIGDQSGEGHDLWNLGLVLDQLGQRKAALAQMEAALRVWEAAGQLPADVERMRQQVAEWKAAGQQGEAREG